MKRDKNDMCVSVWDHAFCAGWRDKFDAQWGNMGINQSINQSNKWSETW